MEIVLAKYKCLKCFYEYEDKAGPTKCPRCEHLYVEWLNYEKFESYPTKDSLACSVKRQKRNAVR